MPKVRFNDRWIKTIRVEISREDFWDELTSGLGLRVSNKGRKIFFCRYKIGKVQRRMNLGSYPALGLSDARNKFRNILLAVEEGGDPQMVKKQAKQAETFADIFQVYIKDRTGVISDKSIQKYKHMYKRHFQRPIGSLKARDLRKAHVIPILRDYAKQAPTQSQRIYQLIQACVNHAVGLDLLDYNPLHKMPRFGFTRIGERYLSAEEIVSYLRKADKLPTVEKVFFNLLIFYGTRSGELSRWKWEWINGDRILIPGEFQKNGRSLMLPFTQSVVNLLQELREETGMYPWLFPNPTKTTVRASFGKNKNRLAEEMALEKDWHLRDIRRTTETTMRELGVAPEVVASILNHNTSQLRKIYDKSENFQAKFKALTIYDKYLKVLKEEGVPEKVVRVEFRKEIASA